MTGKKETPPSGAPAGAAEGPAETNERMFKVLRVLLHPDLAHSDVPMNELFAAQKAAEGGDSSILHSMYDRCVRADIDAQLGKEIIELRAAAQRSGKQEASYDWPAGVLTRLYHSLCQKRGIEPDAAHLTEILDREGWTAASHTGELKGSRFDRLA
jgi:hypothetical protein